MNKVKFYLIITTVTAMVVMSVAYIFAYNKDLNSQYISDKISIDILHDKDRTINQREDETTLYKIENIVQIQLLDVNGLNESEIEKTKPEQLTYKETHQGLEYYPYIFDVDKKENIYLADQVMHKIVVFDKQGEYVKTINLKRGLDKNELPGIADIAVGTDGIYITDSKHIKKYSFDGEFKFEIDYYGSDEEFSIVDQLSITPAGNLSFQGNGIRQIYDNVGDFISGSTGYTPYLQTTDNNFVRILPIQKGLDQIQLLDVPKGITLNSVNSSYLDKDLSQENVDKIKNKNLINAANMSYSKNSNIDYINIDNSNNIYLYESTENSFEINLINISNKNKTKSIILSLPYSEYENVKLDRLRVTPNGEIYFIQKSETLLSVYKCYKQ